MENIRVMNPEKLEIVVKTIHGNIPLNIYDPNFSWRELVFPPIQAIYVKQGKHAAEISDFQQYNFLLEVTQAVLGFGGLAGQPAIIELRRFIIFGNHDRRVDLFIFSINKGVVQTFERKLADWGAEWEGSSTSGWKVGFIDIITT